MRGTFVMAEPPGLAIPPDSAFENGAKTTEMCRTSDLSIRSPILWSQSYTSTQSPLTVSSASDLHSSDIDSGRRGPADGKEVRRRMGLGPIPRFMPRTPGGRTARLEVSGTTPMMRAHLVDQDLPLVVRNEEDKERLADEAATGDLNPPSLAGEPSYHSAPPHTLDEAHPSLAISSPSKLSTPGLDQNQQSAQSLSASVSSIINQMCALEHLKLASTGKIKGGSRLKGSQAWKAQHKLLSPAGSTAGNTATPDSTSYLGGGFNGRS